MTELRQIGITKQQLQQAPKNSVFVWCNSHLDYPTQLAKNLQRFDLVIVSPAWLESNAWRARKISSIVVDHASHLTKKQSLHLCLLKDRMEFSNGQRPTD